MEKLILAEGYFLIGLQENTRILIQCFGIIILSAIKEINER